MIDQDKRAFKQRMDALTEYYGKDQLSEIGLEMYFSPLERFSIDQIKHAISSHLNNTKSGQFMPKVADFVRILEGGEITTDQVIAAARNKKTPLGIFCRIQIGHWDLDHQGDMFYLKQRAEECIQNLPEWKARALKGDYTEHEISMMLKYRVSPLTPFMNGLPAPGNTDQLRLKVNEVLGSERHALMLEDSVQPSKDEFHPKLTALIMQKMEK